NSSPRVSPSPAPLASSPAHQPASVSAGHLSPQDSAFSKMPPENALRLMLLVAGMMIFSLLIIGVGIMIGLLPFVLMIPKAESLGYFGAAFGCIVGGLGSLLGTTNSYRQMAGKSDW